MGGSTAATGTHGKHEAGGSRSCLDRQLVAISVFVGAQGGLSEPIDDGLDLRVNVAYPTVGQVRSSTQSSVWCVPQPRVKHEPVKPGCCGLQAKAPNADNEFMKRARLANRGPARFSAIRVPRAYPRNATGVVSGIA